MEWHFDFFNISGSLFVENQYRTKNRSSAQGFMMMTNGLSILGSFTSGWAIDKYFTSHLVARMIWFLETETTNPKMLEFIKTRSLISADGVLSKEIFMKDWHTIWLAFAILHSSPSLLLFCLNINTIQGSCCCRKSS
jgi:NHS family xanthosine MFS transporter